jgi:hypothetical protein
LRELTTSNGDLGPLVGVGLIFLADWVLGVAVQQGAEFNVAYVDLFLNLLIIAVALK